ncbi:hypothetical protein Q5752_001011 [Cryptotrichosporon argae]
MTLQTTLVSLPGSSAATVTTSFATPSADNDAALASVVHLIRSAQCIVVVCGAGVSTAAAIPDFRSANGLFKSKRRAGNVHDLFHVKSLTSPALLPAHHALLTHLHALSAAAAPTPFHAFLRALDEQGRLLRCYTQNIDGLEEQAGLSTGVPPMPARARRKSHARPLPLHDDGLPPTPSPSPARAATTPAHTHETATTPLRVPDTPRCIPLHGTLTHLTCATCTSAFPIADFVPLSPSAIACPTCVEHAGIRRALSERPRRVGQLRVGVTLYGEEHAQGEAIGAVVERDLRGRAAAAVTAPAASAGLREDQDPAPALTSTSPASLETTPIKPRDPVSFSPSPALTASPPPAPQSTPPRQRPTKPDLVLVAGTSLSIPGVRRIVREFARAVAGAPAPTRSASRGAAPALAVPAIFVNAEPPARAAEWAGTFGAWVQGDVQALVGLVQDAAYVVPAAVSEATVPRARMTGKRKRAAEDAQAQCSKSSTPKTPVRRDARAYPTPRPTPPSPAPAHAHMDRTPEASTPDTQRAERGGDADVNPFLVR